MSWCPLIWRNLIKRLYWGCYSLLALCFDHYSGPLASQPLLWGHWSHTNPITSELLTQWARSAVWSIISCLLSPTFILPSILNIDWWRSLTVTHNIANNSLIYVRSRVNILCLMSMSSHLFWWNHHLQLTQTDKQQMKNTHEQIVHKVLECFSITIERESEKRLVIT